MSRTLLLLFCGCVLLTSSRLQAAQKPFTIGLEPTLSQATSEDAGRQLSDYLAGALGHAFQSRLYKSYDALAEALDKGEIDFAWINPYAFVKASRKANIMPVAKALRSGETYRAVFFVKAGSKIKTLADLKGTKVAWVDPSSTAGYLFPEAILVQSHLDPTTLFVHESFVGSHQAVCEAVLSGAADVGATFHTGNSPKNLRPDGCVQTLGLAVANKVHGFAVSDPIPSEVIAARAGFDMDMALKVGGALAAMKDNPTGQRILQSVFRADGFGLALDSDFEPVRAAAMAVTQARSAADAQDMADAFGGDDKTSAQPKAAKKPAPPSIHLAPHHHSTD